MIIPVPGAQLPRKGGKLDYMYKRSPTHKHRGLDFPAPRGTPVIAAETGKVVRTIHEYTPGFRGYGKVIVVKGVTGRYQLYAHLDSIGVQVGQKVATGQPIGTVGKTAYTKANPTGSLKSGPHLHFEVSEISYPMHSEAPRLNPRVALTPSAKEEPEQPKIEPKKAARRLKRLERSDQVTIAISIAIMGLIWLLTMLKR